MTFMPAGILQDARNIHNANLTDACVIQRNTAAEDPTGGPALPVWTTISPGGLLCRMAEPGLSAAPQVQEALVALQLQGVQAAVLKLPLGTDCTRNDRVTVNGETWQVIGTTAGLSNLAGLYALVRAVGATP